MNGELIALEWSTHLKVNAYIGFTSDLGRPLVNIVDNYLYSAPMAWLARPTCPGYDEINRVTMIMQESGLIEHWRKKALAELEVKSENNVHFSDSTSAMRKMNMQDLLGVFMVMIILFGLALLCFIIECLLLLHLAMKV